MARGLCKLVRQREVTSVIVNALIDHAGRLAVAKLRTLPEGLDTLTPEGQKRENAAWKFIMERTTQLMLS